MIPYLVIGSAFAIPVLSGTSCRVGSPSRGNKRHRRARVAPAPYNTLCMAQRFTLSLLAFGLVQYMYAKSMSCEQLVPVPWDISPLRSSQALHSALAKKFVDRNVVEIGTRSGDTVNCYAQIANRTVAIEMNRNYCKVLRSRREELKNTTRSTIQSATGLTSTNLEGASYGIVCSRYQSAPNETWKDVDYVFWWIEGGIKANIQVLRFLRSVKGLRFGALAMLAHDLTDLDTPAILTPIAEYTEHVLPTRLECENCLARLQQYCSKRMMSLDAHVLRKVGCQRAASVANLIAIRIDSPQLDVLLNTTFREREITSVTIEDARSASLAAGYHPLSATPGKCWLTKDALTNNETIVNFKAPELGITRSAATIGTAKSPGPHSRARHCKEHCQDCDGLCTWEWLSAKGVPARQGAGCPPYTIPWFA